MTVFVQISRILKSSSPGFESHKSRPWLLEITEQWIGGFEVSHHDWQVLSFHMLFISRLKMRVQRLLFIMDL